ncbi:hypothetical protein DICPUDRAFT_41476 [Dictyostelium purpureum]|uniref:UBC core domain-containing protein n=1 Tax=Dictyostelium purpureum TaxID=5786 RepID=F1A071_DICPU|nr:uncharacterized protein DICPUDRAFT_41476 [Dictyostelium purpureum]EGC30405.1 hypothetical protein DICPUDRAFT_41476 [Dictyostelium purpureum]|eukprot:XP_003293073.1 hypothetical protein DICPUDRAFT_41476 [Dictyostelium purpureum]
MEQDERNTIDTNTTDNESFTSVTNTTSNKNKSPVEQQNSPNYRLLYEFKKLSELMIRGLYVIPSFNSIHEWHCVLFIRNRIYRSAIIRFLVVIPDDFPDSCPSVKFLTPMYHPLIGSEGEIDLSHQFSDWTSEKYMIAHVLCYIKSIFHNPDKYNYPPLNQDAYNLMKNNPDNFQKRVSEYVEDSIKNVYDNPQDSAIYFTKEWKDKNQWENTKKQILKQDKGIIDQISEYSSKLKDFFNK